jgi:hypothetical protein
MLLAIMKTGVCSITDVLVKPENVLKLDAVLRRPIRASAESPP